MDISIEDMQRRIANELSLRARVGYTALLLVSVGGAGAIGSLLATEAALPLRTELAFGVLMAIQLAWAAFAAWVLSYRRVLLATHRVVASCMATVFSAVFVLGALSVARWSPAGRSAYAAAGVGVVMLIISGGTLARAQRELRRLTRRREELESAVRD